MKCEYCGKEHDGSYGKGRFCSAYCARGFSTKAKRKQINKKVSSTLRKKSWSKRLSDRNKEMFENGWKPWKKTTNSQKKEWLDKGRETQRKKWLQEKVRHHTKDRGVRCRVTLDITNEFLEEYRKTHTVCEICGKPERISTSNTNNKTNRLCVDYDHNTNKFRGLLCNRCNYKLGWLDYELENVKRYLKDK